MYKKVQSYTQSILYVRAGSVLQREYMCIGAVSVVHTYILCGRARAVLHRKTRASETVLRSLIDDY